MKQTVIIACIALLPGCADLATTVNVAPSAEPQAEQVARVVDRMNREISGEVFTMRITDREHRVDDEIVMRRVGGLGTEPGYVVAGHCKRTRKGVIVRVTPDTTDVQMGHELGHAAGLEHVDDPGNLMYHAATEWGLTLAQRNDLMGAP